MNDSFCNQKICRAFYKEVTARAGTFSRAGTCNRHISYYKLHGDREPTDMTLYLPLVNSFSDAIFGRTTIILDYTPAPALSLMINRLKRIQQAGKQLLETDYANVNDQKAIVRFFDDGPDN